jgi:multidrug efflux pump subunit AcrB
VVDDAIVVVENVTRNQEENPELTVPQATEKAMAEITGPVVATTLILVAVFAPVGFVSGVTGALYRQFATTISVSAVISTVNALTLSPALCALVLKPPKPTRFVGFKVFNRGFNFARDRYGDSVRFLSRKLVVPVVGLLVVFGGSYLLFGRTPRPSCRPRTRAILR